MLNRHSVARQLCYGFATTPAFACVEQQRSSMRRVSDEGYHVSIFHYIFTRDSHGKDDRTVVATAS